MTIRLMCDSDNLSDLIDTPLIATYADLIRDNSDYADLESRFPESRLLFIDRAEGDPLGIASIADFESGTFTPAQLRSWLAASHDLHKPYPTIYSDLDNVPAVKAAVGDLAYWHWIAWYGHVVVPAYPYAVVQAFNGAATGLHLDLSVVHNDAWHPTGATAGWLSPVISELNQAGSKLTTAIGSLMHHNQ